MAESERLLMRISFGPRTGIVRLSVLAFWIMLGLIAMAGCDREQTRADRDIDRANALYQQYLTGTVYQAREAVQEGVKIFSRMKHEEGRATGLCLGYGRLFCIESKMGDTNLAYVCYEKSKYWGLVRLELIGASPAQIKATTEAYTPEQCRSLILKFDAANTKGVGPRYLQ